MRQPITVFGLSGFELPSRMLSSLSCGLLTVKRSECLPAWLEHALLLSMLSFQASKSFSKLVEIASFNRIAVSQPGVPVIAGQTDNDLSRWFFRCLKSNLFRETAIFAPRFQNKPDCSKVATFE